MTGTYGDLLTCAASATQFSDRDYLHLCERYWLDLMPDGFFFWIGEAHKLFTGTDVRSNMGQVLIREKYWDSIIALEKEWEDFAKGSSENKEEDSHEPREDPGPDGGRTSDVLLDVRHVVAAPHYDGGFPNDGDDIGTWDDIPARGVPAAKKPQAAKRSAPNWIDQSIEDQKRFQARLAWTDVEFARETFCQCCLYLRDNFFDSKLCKSGELPQVVEHTLDIFLAGQYDVPIWNEDDFARVHEAVAKAAKGLQRKKSGK